MPFALSAGLLSAGLISAGLVLVAYLLGSFPSGYLAGRLIGGLDIREHGSGSTGATNVLRTVGKVPALLVLLADILKGTLAVWLMQVLGPQVWPTVDGAGPWLALIGALVCLLGHSRSVWLKFTGGKSAATGLGVVLAMSWPVGLGTAAVFVSVVALSRIVSLGSLAAATAVPILMALGQQPLPYILFGLLGGVYVFLRHRANIQRLIQGTEPRIGQKLTSEAADPDTGSEAPAASESPQ